MLRLTSLICEMFHSSVLSVSHLLTSFCTKKLIGGFDFYTTKKPVKLPLKHYLTLPVV